jgi:hypothetical protein
VIRALRPWLVLALAHVLLVLALCGDMVLFGGVPYVRDVAFEYVPDLAFLAQALRVHVWPLWNPLINGGQPYVFGYPIDIALVALLGPIGAARFELPFHLWVAATGASALAAVRGRSLSAAWAAGAFYAASGFVLSCGTVFSLLHGAAWAPWVIAAGLTVLERPGRRSVALLALVAAMQVGTRGAELIVQTAILIAVLGARRGNLRGWMRLVAAGALAAALSGPVLLGARAMTSGTARAEGFSPAVTLSWSMHPVQLPALALPAYFGDMHTFSDVGYWGQPFFEAGYPYLVSVYLGMVVLLLAALGASPRLLLIAAAGVAVSLGGHGPLASAVTAVMGLAHIRVPSKFLFATVVAVVLMAADGLDRARVRRVGAWVFIPGALVTLVATGLLVRPERGLAILAGLSSAFQDPRAAFVVGALWPASFLRAGALALIAGLALWRGGGLIPLAALAAVADLLLAGAPLNPAVAASFYTLREPLRAEIDRARHEGPFRWFSYGAAASTPVRWRADIAQRNRDVPLYAIEVQSLAPRAHELAGLEGAFDEDRNAFAPLGSTFTADERQPSRFREMCPRLRLANVRWVVGYVALPEDLVALRATLPQPELGEPLLVHELRDPLPRAFWISALTPEIAAARVSAEAAVAYDSADPHTVVLRATTPPGFIVVLDGYDAAWTARERDRDVPILRAGDRYWALPTSGGTRTFVARFQPRWRNPSLIASALGLLAACALILAPRRRAPVVADQPAR